MIFLPHVSHWSSPWGLVWQMWWGSRIGMGKRESEREIKERESQKMALTPPPALWDATRQAALSQSPPEAPAPQKKTQTFSHLCHTRHVAPVPERPWGLCVSLHLAGVVNGACGCLDGEHWSLGYVVRQLVGFGNKPTRDSPRKLNNNSASWKVHIWSLHTEAWETHG